MCVRCGTGRVAGCTRPDGHERRESTDDGFTGAVIDHAGDVWGLRAGATMWECLADAPGEPALLTLAELEGTYGPLRWAGGLRQVTVMPPPAPDGKRRHDEASRPHPCSTGQPAVIGQARRGDEVEAWLRHWRDQFQDAPEWHAIDDVISDYQVHADTGVPLNIEVRAQE
jgi:hypothetical protein